MNLLEAKAKFFDMQRVIEQKDAELKQLIELRQNLCDVYEVRFASWLAYIGADASENAAAVAYEAAVAAADTILADVAEDVYDSLVTLLGALCAA